MRLAVLAGALAFSWEGGNLNLTILTVLDGSVEGSVCVVVESLDCVGGLLAGLVMELLDSLLVEGICCVGGLLAGLVMELLDSLLVEGIC